MLPLISDPYRVCLLRGENLIWVELERNLGVWYIKKSWDDLDHTPLTLSDQEKASAKVLAQQIYNYIEKGSL